jgi:hypothetical protein
MGWHGMAWGNEFVKHLVNEMSGILVAIGCKFSSSC